MKIHLYLVAMLLQSAIVGGQRFKEADFVSDWLPLQAQGGAASTLDVPHGLGIVPDIVEVLVKAISGPNENFTFKAMGNGERDDDHADYYGGVVYIYNHQYVKVLAPNRCNQYSVGSAIYTGDTPYWAGVNYQRSNEAHVQVKCWVSSSLPAPCFNSTGTPISSGTPSFVEMEHGTGQYPQFVKVRVKLIGAGINGWYSDGQGSATGFLDKGPSASSGLKYGYNDSVVRIWAWSRNDGFQHYLFEAHDGWSCSWDLVTKTGELDVQAWCDMGLNPVYEHILEFGPSVDGDDLELQFSEPILGSHDGDVLFSLMARVETGVNAGFMFEGVGSAKSNSYKDPAVPCTYGGIIYAYSDTGIRMWRPDMPSGAAVCINENFGGGAYAQGAANVTVIIRIWKRLSLKLKHNYRPPLVLCSHFHLAGANSSYNATIIGEKADVTSLVDCNKVCLDDLYCSTFSYSNSTCNLFSSFNETLLLPESESEVWTQYPN